MTRCPVPSEQQPINEYEDMKTSWFYSWGCRPLRGYLTPLIVLWSLSWLVVGPVVSVNFTPGKWPVQFVMLGTAGALVLPLLTLAQLYVGWRHVGDRLRQPAVPYEESGWYDGQVWIKPETIADRDRLITDYEVKPILNRIHISFATIASVLLVESLLWQLI
ncbi:MAG: CGLD27 family protein [Cyanobacteria bacterium P01_A01_bin.123]